MKATIDKVKDLRRELDAIGRKVGEVRDKLEDLVEDAKEELASVEDAKETLDELINRLSEHH